jgi:alpha-beta hydrolase superfamily lysophospholipase
MDEYAGTDPNPPVLVIIQGRGAFAGHYGNVMKQGLENGIRVIAPDGDPASASVLWGEKDGWIAPADLRTMAAAMPLPACHDAGHR